MGILSQRRWDISSGAVIDNGDLVKGNTSTASFMNTGAFRTEVAGLQLWGIELLLREFNFNVFSSFTQVERDIYS